jgi:predicted membrane protein
MGVGELKLDLSGERKQNLEVKIDGGIGHGTIYLPETIGVRVKVEGGIGSVDSHSLAKTGDYYTNEAYGKTDVTLDIQVEAGIGSIDLRLK